MVATVGVEVAVIKGARGGGAMRGDDGDRRLVHAVHDDLDFVYSTFLICDSDRASFQDCRDPVLGLDVGRDSRRGWGLLI